jgi:serine protease
MRRFTVFAAAFASVVCLTQAGAAAPSGIGAERSRIYVVHHPDARGAAQRALAMAGAELHHDLPDVNAFAVSVPAVAVDALSRNPAVAYVEPDPKRYLLSETTPYGITMVQADQVAEGANVASTMVCIIDSGVNLPHEDLNALGTQFGGTNDSGTGNWYVDENGHGTHVAGTVVATGANAKGVVGVAAAGTLPIHVIKVFDQRGWAYSSSLAAALTQCESAGSGKKLVVSMSLGGSSKSRTEESAFKNAWSRGVLAVAAAGNGGNTQMSYPASYSSVISVAAIDSAKVVATFSQKNSQVELAAPGVGVWSTERSGTGRTVTLDAAGSGYEANPMDGTPFGSASAAIVSCGLGDTVGGTACAVSGGKICLISRGGISFADKVNNCQSSGGVAAIIYNDEPGELYGTLGTVVTNIPSVGVSQATGQSILAALPASGSVSVAVGHYGRRNGTSMATPHVSAVAAVVWSHNGAWTNQQIRDALGRTAEDLGEAGRDTSYGYGLVQAKAALDSLRSGDTGGDTGGGGKGGGKPPKGSSR